MIFVLHRPQVPENIGAAARAIYTMGFDELRLVDTQMHDHEKCRWLACHAFELIKQAKVYPTLEAAVEDIDVVIGTTARPRRDYYDYLTPPQIRTFVGEKMAQDQRVALVFGPEDTGLTNDELEFCDILTSIPANRDYGVLNLSQAVMIYAYELQTLNSKMAHPGKRRSHHQLSHRVFKSKMSELFQLVDVDANDLRVKRALEKASYLTDEDVRLLHYFRKKILFKVDRENWRRGR